MSLVLPVLSTGITHSQNIPEGYILQYEQNFSKKNACNDFVFSSPESWSISSEKGNCFLSFADTDNYDPPFSSPRIIAVFGNLIFGDFILEADLMQTDKNQNGAGLCIFYGIKDSVRYYFANLGNNDSIIQNLYLVNNNPAVAINTDLVRGISWGEQKWHKIRIERNIITRSTKVYFDNMQKPVLKAVDWTLVMGYIGFGSYNNSGRIDNIKIWSQTSISEPAGFFRKKAER